MTATKRRHHISLILAVRRYLLLFSLIISKTQRDQSYISELFLPHVTSRPLRHVSSNGPKTATQRTCGLHSRDSDVLLFSVLLNLSFLLSESVQFYY